MAETSADLKLGLDKAVELVEQEAGDLRKKGLTGAFVFFRGIATCVLTTFLMAGYGGSVWIVYAIEGIIILGARLVLDYRKRNPRELFHFFDLCWVSNFCMVGLTAAVLLNVLDDHLLGNIIPNGYIGRHYPDIGRMFCLLATGPLGWSVIALNNALLFHDLGHFSSCFIHLWPSLVTLSMRWNPALVMQAYPGHFDMLTGYNDNPRDAGLIGLILLGAKWYIMWWVPFTIWMLAHGRKQSPRKTGWTTVYFGMVVAEDKTKELVVTKPGKMLGIVQPDDAHDIAPALKYMATHATLVMLSLVWSAFCYKYMWLHAFFCFVLVSVALYNASVRYDFLLTRKYSVALESYIKANFPEKKED